jgi:hypothetical protein
MIDMSVKHPASRSVFYQKNGMVHLPEKHLYKLSHFTRQIRDE